MVTVRPAEARGLANHGWLDSRHTFSFADYYDPAQMGFRALRVINEDRVEPGTGFGPHPHRDMEIISYVLQGSLEHKDNLGNGSVVRRGEVQRMTAGRGIVHSEGNPSSGEGLHFLQIWIEPDRPGLEPGYQQAASGLDSHPGELVLIAAPEGDGGALSIHQDVRLFAARLAPGSGVSHPLAAGRHAWVQVVEGAVLLGETLLGQGSGAAVSGESELAFKAAEETEILLFDLA